MEPLHLGPNLTIHEQTHNRAVAEAYIIYIPIEIAVFDVSEKTFLETGLTGTARYTWGLLKSDYDIWRINPYKISFS